MGVERKEVQTLELHEPYLRKLGDWKHIHQMQTALGKCIGKKKTPIKNQENKMS